MKEALIEKILPVFLNDGISTHTIQALSRKIGISTKTLYKTFGNKENLLVGCLDVYYERFLKNIREIYERNPEAVPAFLTATDYILSQEFNISKKFFTDLNLNFKEIQDHVLNKTSPKFPDLSVEILKKGIGEGTVEADVIPEIFLIGYARLYHSITRESAYTNLGYDTPVILQNTLYSLIKGILTKSGLQQYDNHFSRNNKHH